MNKQHKNKKLITVVIANDFQIPFHDEKALALFKQFLYREKPHWLVLNGDFQDFWEISSFDLTPKIGAEFTQEIKIGKKILKAFRRILPRARITWIEGNHDAQHVARIQVPACQVRLCKVAVLEEKNIVRD